MRKFVLALVIVAGGGVAVGCATVAVKGGSAVCSACDGTGEAKDPDPATGIKGKCRSCDGSGKAR